jgi:iron-sulfur cluster repair protein YtfE (RIC family)
MKIPIHEIAPSEWRSKSLNLLVDRLVEDHHSFRVQYLPQIESRLERLKAKLGPAPAPAVEALSDFRNFRREFAWHMDEEESFLYPKILRTEACLHDPDRYPEIFVGSITAFSSAHIQLPEEAFQVMFTSLSQKMRALPIDPLHADAMKEILPLLADFGHELASHTYLESMILFPWTAESEAVLRERAAKRML